MQRMTLPCYHKKHGTPSLRGNCISTLNMMYFGSFVSNLRAPNVTARKALPFIRYDGYTENHTAQSLKDDSVPLAQILVKRNYLSARPEPPGARFITNELLRLPCETGCYTDRIATEDGKLFCSSLLEALWEVEQLGECFENFDASNIYLRGRKAVLHGVKRQNLQRTQLMLNYNSAKKIIEDAFRVYGRIPDDIQHLLNMIENEHDKRSLYRVHASLWSLSSRGGKYMRMHEQLKILDAPVRDAILQIIGQLTYIASWRLDVQTNPLLHEIFLHPSANYSVSHLQNVVGPLAVQLREIREGRLFSDYQRNRVAHRMDKYAKFRPFFAQGTELIALVRWPLALPVLQYELHKVRSPEDPNNGDLY